MIEKIKHNAELVVQQLTPLAGNEFGYNEKSVKWLDDFIERMRNSGAFANAAQKQRYISMFGSYLGECVIRNHGGTWVEHDGTCQAGCLTGVRTASLHFAP